jgi:hypothetical protein
VASRSPSCSYTRHQIPVHAPPIPRGIIEDEVLKEPDAPRLADEEVAPAVPRPRTVTLAPERKPWKICSPVRAFFGPA